MERQIEAILEGAYEKYRGHNDWKTRFSAEGLTSKEIAATLLGNFNYQIENGGIFQYWDNKFSHEKGPNGTEAHLALAGLIERFRGFDEKVAEKALHALALVSDAGGLGEARVVWTGDEDDQFDDPIGTHFSGEKVTDGYCGFHQDRRLDFLDRIVSAVADDENIFVTEFRHGAKDRPGIRYPHIVIELESEPENAHAILGRAAEAMRRAGVPKAEIDTYLADAKSGSYEDLLETTRKWVRCQIEPAHSFAM